MLLRKYVAGLEIEGLDVEVNGMALTIAPGKLVLPTGQAELTEPCTMNFPPPIKGKSNVVIGFDMLGRLFVERGQKDTNDRFGTMTIYIHFEILSDTEDLKDVPIFVLSSQPQ